MVLDATAHFRNCVHPGYALYYRGDKHYTFILGQIMCNFAGSRLFSLDLLRRHNNDQGFYFCFYFYFLNLIFFLILRTFNMTIRKKIERDLIRILGDGGYQHLFILTQFFVPSNEVKTLQFLRGIVEIIFDLVHMFKGATERFREMPGDDQIVCLLIIYEIIAQQLQKCPIRSQLLQNFRFQPTPIASSMRFQCSKLLWQLVRVTLMLCFETINFLYKKSFCFIFIVKSKAMGFGP